MEIVRSSPNILITGTPGTGKTTLGELVASNTGLQMVEVSRLIKEKDLHDGRDEEFDCFILDEDKVCDELEDQMTRGGNIIDFHSCDFFPERWFDLVIVLRTDNSILYPRLEKRGYNQKKITENIECEILQVVLDEAADSYRPEILWELENNTVEQMTANAEKIQQWISTFQNSMR
eukprot:TRINITY_DN9928_c0_g1_i1.p1 TRINITY_DN9928_c0_g1~~TRINITY_DN9928_c0_g1_i1.p1  ORF type:complete len:188 (-),score=45.17 TRINITY_DN9928_c0_g1_i1:24-551(-)